MESEEIIERIKKWPENYKTLLKLEYGRNTCTVILKRKILKLIKIGTLGRIYLNGSRGCENLIYFSGKDYAIIIINRENKFRYIVCKEKNIKRRYNNINLKKAKELLKSDWVLLKDNFLIKETEVIKFL